MRADAEARAAVGDLTGAHRPPACRAAGVTQRHGAGLHRSVGDRRAAAADQHQRRQLALELRGDNRRVPGPDEPLPPQ
jgi:hypothetical protein